MTAKKPAPAAKPAAKTSDDPKLKAAASKPASKFAAPAKTAKAPAKPAAKSAAKTETKGPAKPAAKAGKKGSALEAEVDLGDIEADLEGEPEVVVAGEKEVKAKPLRMKVSRAKERALMREFGLEETTLTEEEAAKRRHELKTLIKMGKTRGFLTHQEINDHLPEKLINEEILEAIISMLNDDFGLALEVGLDVAQVDFRLGRGALLFRLAALLAGLGRLGRRLGLDLGFGLGGGFGGRLGELGFLDRLGSCCRGCGLGCGLGGLDLGVDRSLGSGLGGRRGLLGSHADP